MPLLVLDTVPYHGEKQAFSEKEGGGVNLGVSHSGASESERPGLDMDSATLKQRDFREVFKSP